MSDLFKEKIEDLDLKSQVENEKKDCIQIGEICVEIEYSKDNKSIYDCMMNLLKRKIQGF